MSEQSITILAAVLLLVAGWCFTIWLRNSNRTAEEQKETDKWRADVELRLTKMEFPVATLWAKVQRQLSEDLHHPEAGKAEMDELLEKLDKVEISVPETARLKELLIHRSEDKNTQKAERASARIMATVMDRVLEEAALAKQGAELQKVELVGEVGPIIEEE